MNSKQKKNKCMYSTSANMHVRIMSNITVYTHAYLHVCTTGSTNWIVCACSVTPSQNPGHSSNRFPTTFLLFSPSWRAWQAAVPTYVIPRYVHRHCWLKVSLCNGSLPIGNGYCSMPNTCMYVEFLECYCNWKNFNIFCTCTGLHTCM